MNDDAEKQKTTDSGQPSSDIPPSKRKHNGKRTVHPGKNKYAPKRTPDEIRRHRQKISELMARGYTQMEMAAYLKISRDMVQFDIEYLDVEWKEAVVKNVSTAKARQIHRLQQIIKEAWRKYEHGGQRNKRTTKTGKRGKATVTTDDEKGDPRLLEIILKTEERISRLQGLDAPVRLSHSTVDGLPIIAPVVSPTTIVRIKIPDNGRDVKK